MKTIKLTQGKETLVDDGDYEYLSKWKWCYHSGYALGYIQNKVTRKYNKVYIHRVIMGVKKGQEIDHKDGDKLNNQKSNLRMATRSENNMNRGIPKNNKSGYKGVSWSKSHKRWKAEIKVNRKYMFLGRFTNKVDAAKAYNEAAKKYFGEFRNSRK